MVHITALTLAIFAIYGLISAASSHDDKCDPLTGTCSANDSPDFVYRCDDLVSDDKKCTLKETKGTFQHDGFDITYWTYEAEDAATRRSDVDAPPLVLLHGGPAATSRYFIPLKWLACTGRKVVRYDQAGCGDSSPMTDVNENAPQLLTIPYYVKELDALTDHLGIKKFYALGHSWGSVLAQEYALQTPSTTKLAGLILAGPLSDAQLYINEQRKRVHTLLPKFIVRRIQALEESKAYASAEYQALSNHLNGHFTVRTIPMPDCCASSFAALNPEIYVAMQGSSEFTIGGVLESWNVTGKLHSIKLPTLVSRGQFDTMTESVAMAIVDNIEGAKYIEYPRAGHMTPIDEPELMIESTAAFMDAADKKFQY